MKRIMMAAAVTALATAGLAGTASAAAPDGAGQGGKPFGIQCQQNGIAALKSVGALQSVAKGGLPIATAVSLDVTVRPGADISGVPDPIPFSVVLADHRAGTNSLFVYPWCGN